MSRTAYRSSMAQSGSGQSSQSALNGHFFPRARLSTLDTEEGLRPFIRAISLTLQPDSYKVRYSICCFVMPFYSSRQPHPAVQPFHCAASLAALPVGAGGALDLDPLSSRLRRQRVYCSQAGRRVTVLMVLHTQPLFCGPRHCHQEYPAQSFGPSLEHRQFSQWTQDLQWFPVEKSQISLIAASRSARRASTASAASNITSSVPTIARPRVLPDLYCSA